MNKLLLLLFVASFSMVMSAQENSQWRGKNRDGIYTETYIYRGRGVFTCYDEKSLDLVWTKDFNTDFDGGKLKFGVNESSLIVGYILYATPGGE